MFKSKMKIFRIPNENGEVVPMPKYGSEKAACFDMFSNNYEPIIIPSHKTVKVSSGIKTEIESGFQLKLHNRSGFSTKDDIVLAHCVGTIDEDYRGEITIPLYNRSNTDYVLEPHSRVCQAEVIPAWRCEFEEILEESELTTTARDDGGYGSSGMK